MKTLLCLFLISFLFAFPLRPTVSHLAEAKPESQLRIDNFCYQRLQADNNYIEDDTPFVLSYGGTREYLKVKGPLSKMREKICSRPPRLRKQVVDFALSVGLSLEEAMSYAFPEIEEGLSRLEKKIYRPPSDAYIKNIQNTGKITICGGQEGQTLDREKIYKKIYKDLDQISSLYIIDIVTTPILYNIDKEQLEKQSFLRASFSSSFASSSAERKNNIMLAMKSLDGLTLKSGQTLSFNSCTGLRSEEQGYKRAKIIKNGIFVDEVGGGVCQASTTLYNAALLADLEIVEVHPHSLPVSYIPPCFDAMVSGGSSDLKIKNNTEGDIMVCTRCDDSSCTVNIYGYKNIYQIVRKSEKIQDLLQIDTITTTNAELFDKKPEKGESIVISEGKPGYKAKGWLEYYKDGVLIKTRQLRTNTYNPTKRVVLVGE